MDRAASRVTTRFGIPSRTANGRTRLPAAPNSVASTAPQTRLNHVRGLALRTTKASRTPVPPSGKAVRTPAFPKKASLTIPISPKLSKPRISSVRKPYERPKVNVAPRTTSAPLNKRRLTVPVSPNITKPRAVIPAPPIRKKVQTKIQASPKKRRLTTPVSPNLTKRPVRRTTERLSATSKELLEIEAKRKEVMLERRRNEQYHQATQGIRPSSGSNMKSKFTMTLRSAGVIGVPAIRRPKLTTFKEFHFLTDKRALEKETHPKRPFSHTPSPAPKRRRTIE
ncbi:hypothetical protein Ae201684_002344 [Aphanomyces euteiches]|uniref:Uncharacterized protein n=1 Tax=Aphanomyces euteiches TaxID=100861 RepID=A0A6G0XQQ3_9STRA|nr:hypothetical protein Ae201684_002344 [Aphanomyces euteiches]